MSALCLLLALIAASDAFAQSPASSLRPRTGGLRIVPQPAPADAGASPTQREFDQMVSSAASFDMDSPVEAQAEFEPTNAAPGSPVLFRIEVSGLEESLTLPDKMPWPAGLKLEAGGKGQTYVPTGMMKLRPQSTFIFRGVAPNSGTYTVPEFEMMAYGKPVKVPAATLTVAAPGAPVGEAPLKLMLRLPPGDCYVGQLLHIALILPNFGNDGPFGFSRPQVRGDYIFAESATSGMRHENVVVDGKLYGAMAQDVLITPLRAGTLDLIGGAQAMAMRRLPGTPNGRQVVSLFIDSDRAKLEIKPLPSNGVLAGFNGAVGEYVIDPPELSTRHIKVGEPVTLTITVHGDGNLGRLAAPALPVSKDWQVFTSPGDAMSAAFIDQVGYVRFKYVFIPLNARDGMTPAIPFSAFDPVKKRYVNLTIPGVKVEIEAGLESRDAQKEAVALNGANPDSAGDVKPAKAARLTGIVKTPGAARNLRPLQQRAWFQAGQIVPALVIAIWFYVSRRRRYLAEHPEILVRRAARKELRREIKVIQRAVLAKDQPAFTLAAAKALQIACAPHLAAEPRALVCSDVLGELNVSGRSNGQGELVRQVFRAADDLRFAKPPSYDKDLLTLQRELQELLGQLKERL